MSEADGWRHDMALAALLESEGFQSFDLSLSLRAIVEAGAEALEAARCSLWQENDQPRALSCLILYDEESGGHNKGPVMLEADDPDCFWLLNKPVPQCFHLHDPELPPVLASFMAGHGFSAMMQWPVVVQGTLIALLAFADRRAGRQWSEGDRVFARILASLAATAFRGDQLRREAAQQARVATAPLGAICRPAPVADGSANRPQRPNCTILLVDADTAVHELLGEALNHGSYRLIHAFDQPQGFTLAADILPDVIVLNVLSPGLDGWGLLAQLKNHDSLRHIPVVLLTLSGEEEAGFLLRASDFLTKPFRFELLLETINRHRSPVGLPKVMVVEDEEVTRSVLVRLLERDGWKVEAATNGYEGLRRLESFKPSVVLLDLMMPGMDGFEFIRLLRMTEQPGKHLPLVVVTAKDLTDEEKDWLTGTTRSFATKEAISREDLVDTIRDWVGHATARRTVVY